MTFETKFSYRDRVCIDQDHSIIAVVISFVFRTTQAVPIIKCSWIHNGEVKTQFFEE